jgi:23S rRNA (adenine2503-C2)-methyltransferase
MSTTRRNLLGLTQQELSDFVKSIGLPSYRGKQLFGWMYAKDIRDFEHMTDLGKPLRDQLAQSACFDELTLVTQQRSHHDNTTKFLFQLPDGLKIESVLIPPRAAFRGKEASGEDEQRRLTVCVSTQVGCPLNCRFCATATMGFGRNLTTGEIIDQVLLVNRLSKRPITNVVFMGMGEPLMNYENVMKAVDIITTGIGIAARRTTISTAGWADKIRRMADEQRKVKLAVSLHSADDATRTKLMPINKKFNLHALMSALEYYCAHTKKRVTYEYIFFDGVNDSDEDVKKLIRLARRVPCKINVIPFHPIHSAGRVAVTGASTAALRPSPRMPEIVETLRAHDLNVMVRSSAGEDIDGACGQLTVKVEPRKRRYAKFSYPLHQPAIF